MRPGRAADHSPPFLVPRSWNSRAILSNHPLGHTGPVTGSLFVRDVDGVQAMLNEFLHSVTNLNKKKNVSRRYLSRKQVSADLPFTYTMAFFYAPCQFTPHINLRHLIFWCNASWQVYFHLFPFLWEYNFLLTSTFSETLSGRKTRAWYIVFAG